MTNWTPIIYEHLPKSSGSDLPAHVKVPSLPQAVLQFARKADEPDVTNTELASIVETDDGMTCALLRRVNCSTIGLRRKIASIERAIHTLGIQACKLYLMTEAIENSMNPGESKLIDLHDFWKSNLERALFAREVAELLDADVEMAFTGGLLQDFLLPWLANHAYEEYIQFMKQQAVQPIELVEFEEHRSVWNHAAEAARLLQTWRIPDELVCCVLLHHHGLDVLQDQVLKDTSVAAVCVSALIPDTLLQVPDGLESLIQLNESWPEFDLFKIAARVDDQFEELSPSPGSRMTLQQRIEEQHSKMGTNSPSENIDQPQADRETAHTADAASEVQ